MREALCAQHAARGLGPRSGEEGNFELASRSPRGGPGAASRVTSLTTSYEPSALRNNGRNRILPSCFSEAPQTNTQTQQYHRRRSSCCWGGGDGSCSSCRGSRSSSRLPPAASRRDSRLSQLYLFDVSRTEYGLCHYFKKAPVSPLGKQRSKQLPHAQLCRLWRKFTLHIIRLFACT